MARQGQQASPYFDKESLAQLEQAESVLTTEKVLARSIPWDNLRGANIIQARDVELINRYDKHPIETKLNIFQMEGDDYASLFLKMVATIQKEETLQYLLTLIEELLLADETKATAFLRLKDVNPSYPVGPFFRFLSPVSENDWYITSKAAKILAILLLKTTAPATDDVQNLLRWVSSQVKTKKSSLDLGNALGTLQIILRKDQYRTVFFKEDGLATLGGLLRDQAHHQTPNFQIIYQALQCLWLLSYNAFIAENFGDSEIVFKIGHILKSVNKEKVTRMSLATLKNLLDKKNNNEKMIEAGLLKVVEKLLQNKCADEDIVSDLEALQESLQKNLTILSSWDMYKQELLSGQLEWSPVHRSEKFWRENATRFEDNQGRALGALMELLTDPNSTPTILSIACFDIGEFVRFHPRGRAIMHNLNAKPQIMKLLMSNQDSEVQKHALLCLQKIMVHNWEYLGN